MAEAVAEHRVRVRVFVDFWNFQLSLNNLLSAGHFKADWKVLGSVLAEAAAEVVDPGAQVAYQGMDVYGSYGEGTADAGLRKWAESWLARQPGVHVEMRPRRKVRSGPACPSCHRVVATCPVCAADMRGSEEKGVDTRITTAMVSLAWIDNYDVAVLVSSDPRFRTGSGVPGNEGQEGRPWRVSARRSGANAKVLGVDQHPRYSRSLPALRVILGVTAC